MQPSFAQNETCVLVGTTLNCGPGNITGIDYTNPPANTINVTGGTISSGPTGDGINFDIEVDNTAGTVNTDTATTINATDDGIEISSNNEGVTANINNHATITAGDNGIVAFVLGDQSNQAVSSTTNINNTGNITAGSHIQISSHRARSRATCDKLPGRVDP